MGGSPGREDDRICGRREGKEEETVAGERGGEKDAVTSTLTHAWDILHLTCVAGWWVSQAVGFTVGTTAKGVKTQCVTVSLPFHKGEQ